MVLVILHGDLALAVGPHIGHLRRPCGPRPCAAHLLGQGQGQGHQLRRLVAGVAEHHALVTGAVAQLAVGALLVLQGFVHAHGDVGGLLVDGGDHGAGVAVKAVLAPVIADVPDHLPGDVGDVHIAAGGDLAHHVDQSGAGRGLTGHAAQGILRQDGVQDGVGDLVADLVGMPLGDGFGSKETMAHWCVPPNQIRYVWMRNRMGGVGDLSVVLGSEGGPVRTAAGPALPSGFPRRLRRGSPAFSGESRRKERRGLRPLDPRLFIAARSHSLIFGVVVSGRIVGLLLPVYSDRFGTHFPEKHAEKYFYERQSPNQGTDMGAVLALRPGQCGTTAKTSECQRADPKKGGAGARPRDSLRPGFL